MHVAHSILDKNVFLLCFFVILFCLLGFFLTPEISLVSDMVFKLLNSIDFNFIEQNAQVFIIFG